MYHNSKNNGKASARYMFPVPAGAAVCSFRMETTSGKKVKAVVKEVSKAKKEYTAAVAKGKWAGLVEQLTGDGEYGIKQFWKNPDFHQCLSYLSALFRRMRTSRSLLRWVFPSCVPSRLDLKCL